VQRDDERRIDLRSALSRRAFLRLGAASLPAVAAFLTACRRASPPVALTAPILGPDRPVAWPVRSDAELPSGRPIERGATLRIYEWREYLSPHVVDDFRRRFRRYDVQCDVTSFEDREESLAVVRRPDADFDIFFPTIDAIPGLVADGLVRPLNHDYLPNLANLWPQFLGHAPFYDVGLRYTIPYTVFSSGVGWRRDLVRQRDAPDAVDDPLGIFWNGRYRDRVGVYDAYREALALALQHDGVHELNTGDPVTLATGADALIAMIDAVNVRITADGAYEGLPRGEFAVHQAWSGDVLSARRFGGDPSGAARLGYWWPADGTGVVGCDLMAVLSRGRNPVLAHAFLNHILDAETSIRNFSWNGYQPPLTDATAETLLSERSPGPSSADDLTAAILTPQAFSASQMLLPLEPVVDARWIQQWSRFTARLDVTR
jgi:spermidine/putrescine transport system substrate-binding protein